MRSFRKASARAAQDSSSIDHIPSTLPRSTRKHPRRRHPTFRCILTTPLSVLTDRILLDVCLLVALFINNPILTKMGCCTHNRYKKRYKSIAASSFRLRNSLVLPRAATAHTITWHIFPMAETVGHNETKMIFLSIIFSLYRT